MNSTDSARHESGEEAGFRPMTDFSAFKLAAPEGALVPYRGGARRAKRNRGVIFFVLLVSVFSLLGIAFTAMFLAEQPALPEPPPAGLEDEQEPAPEVLQPGEAGGTGVVLKNSPTPKVEYTVDESGILAIPQIAKKVQPSVVGIICLLRDGSENTGSGIAMTEDGYIITNAHVIEGAVSITILDHRAAEYEALLVGSDSQTDIAVVKAKDGEFTPAEFGDSSVLEVGETAVAIGNPLGMELFGSLTAGVVSASSRDIVIGGRKVTLIQTDASVNPGNSGGPLVNHFGQVVGITSIKLGLGAYEGLGFAIPINFAKPIVDELIEKGYIGGRPMIGITVQPVDIYATKYYKFPEGLCVIYVDDASDAAAKGIKVGDIITEADGVVVTTNSALLSEKDRHAIGDEMTLKIYRDGKYFEVAIILGGIE